MKISKIKKVLALSLATVMIVGTLPVAFAKTQSNEKSWGDLQQAIYDNSEVVLDQDYLASENDEALVVPENRVIDLNGHYIDRGLFRYDSQTEPVPVDNGNVITVSSGAHLTINDSSAKGTQHGIGAILGGCNTDNESNSSFGGGIYVSEGSTLTVNEGAIKSNYGKYGAGVHVDGKFEFNGGMIGRNRAEDNVLAVGGLFVDDNATVDLNGGSIGENVAIADNTTKAAPIAVGGLYAGSSTMVHMTGGGIINNSAFYGALAVGGVYLRHTVTSEGHPAHFYMDAGDIGGNFAKDAGMSVGGVAVTNSFLALSEKVEGAKGATINDNTATSYNNAVGGVFLNTDTVNDEGFGLRKGSQIAGNKARSVGDDARVLCGGVYCEKGYLNNAGEIVNNTAEGKASVATVGGAYVPSSSPLYPRDDTMLYGSAKIDNNTVAGANSNLLLGAFSYINFNYPNVGMSVGVDTEAKLNPSATICKAGESAYAEYIHADSPDKKVVFNSEKKTLDIVAYDHWQKVGNQWSYIRNGEAVKGWQNNIPGWKCWFYFDNNGIMQTGWHNDISGWEGKWFHFDDNGVMDTGWKDNISGWVGKWFHFDTTTGVMNTGWNQLPWSEGTDWFYFYTDSGVMASNTITPDGYAVDGNGVWRRYWKF